MAIIRNLDRDQLRAPVAAVIRLLADELEQYGLEPATHARRFADVIDTERQRRADAMREANRHAGKWVRSVRYSGANVRSVGPSHIAVLDDIPDGARRQRILCGRVVAGPEYGDDAVADVAPPWEWRRICPACVAELANRAAHVALHGELTDRAADEQLSPRLRDLYARRAQVLAESLVRAGLPPITEEPTT